MLRILRRMTIFILPILVGVFLTFLIPTNVWAQGESDALTSAVAFSYCSGFKSQLAPYSAKEKALFLYHQNASLAWDPELAFQAGATSSGRLLEELERGADDNDLRIVISRVVGELCGFTTGESGLLRLR